MMVLDVSGSMKGTKLSLLKKATIFVIQNLGPADRLSIVSFSTYAKRVFPLRRMSDDGRESAIIAVESLQADDLTDIVDGLKKGALVLKERRETNPFASVMLLSDGLDTNFKSYARGLIQQFPDSICFSKTENGIPIHTFGFGKDHCPITLHAISNASSGTVSFIESVEMIQDSFAMCIGGLLSVVAQEVCLTVKSASSGVKILEIPSGGHVNEISDEGQQGVVHLGNMYAEEDKQFLVYLVVPKSTAPMTSLLEVFCTYKYLASNEMMQVQCEKVEILRPKVCSSAEKAVCVEVDRQRNRVSVAKAIAEAQEMADNSDLQGARATLSRERSTLKKSTSVQAGDSLTTWLEAQLSEIIYRMSSMDVYTQTGRAYTLSEMSTHSMQRAAITGYSQTFSLTDGDHSYTNTSVFETSNMSRMLRLLHTH